MKVDSHFPTGLFRLKARLFIALAAAILLPTGIFAQDEGPAPTEESPGENRPALPLDGQIYDLHPPREIPLFTPAEWVLLGLAVAVVAGFACCLLYWLLKNRKKKETAPSPYHLARQDLGEAAQYKSIAEVKTFSIALSQAVRLYIERAFHLPAPERTTEEFLPEVRSHPIFKGELSDRLGDFLHMCDLAKFARQQFDESGLDRIQSLAEEIVDKAHLQQMQAHSRDTQDAPPPASTKRGGSPEKKEAVAG